MRCLRKIFEFFFREAGITSSNTVFNFNIINRDNWPNAIKWHLDVAVKIREIFVPKVKEYFNRYYGI